MTNTLIIVMIGLVVQLLLLLFIYKLNSRMNAIPKENNTYRSAPIRPTWIKDLDENILIGIILKQKHTNNRLFIPCRWVDIYSNEKISRVIEVLTVRYKGIWEFSNYIYAGEAIIYQLSEIDHFYRYDFNHAKSGEGISHIKI